MAERFCCEGCRAVAQLLQAEGLGRYYALAPKERAPAPAPAPGGHVWLAELWRQAQEKNFERPRLSLDVQGIQCAACVWLIRELFRRDGGGAGLEVNPALGRIELTASSHFDLDGWVRHVESFGYRFGPARKSAPPRDVLALRLGVAAALTLNVMLFSLSFELGLSARDGEVFGLFGWLSLLLSTGVVVLGGGPFFISAVRALKAGVLHLDLPIALGILLVWSVSLAQALGGRASHAYFDTLCVFITLMLLGRWLQARLVERHRRFLLDDDGADGLWVRRFEAERLRSVNAPKLRTHDRFLVAPGDVVPLDATLLSPSAVISTEWVSGEPATRTVAQHALLRAGSVNAGQGALQVEAAQDFAQSELSALLRRPLPGTRGGPHQRFWDALARRWVLTVLAVSALGTLLWIHAGLPRALDVAAGLLVVTCPCAIGLAIPLAYELTHQRLRRAGFFARRDDLLDRLLEVNTVLFDKTGTLTLGRLEPIDPAALHALWPEARDAAFNLSVRSAHPVSRCLADALEQHGARFDPDATVVEHPGKGLEWQHGAHFWRLGRPGWASDYAPKGAQTVLGRDRILVADLSVQERLRPGAAAELDLLRRDGLSLHLLSGDTAERVSALGARLGFDVNHASGALTPEAKAARVRQLDRGDTLYLGDGVNDAPAFAASYCAGTPAIERPVLPARSDFFLMGEGLKGLRAAFDGALLLRRTVNQLLAIALTYNGVAISVGLAGGLTPLRAAVAMPLSTLSLLAFVTWRLGAHSPDKNHPTPKLIEAGAHP